MTSTAEIEDALIRALTTIRTLWPTMHQPSAGSIALDLEESL